MFNCQALAHFVHKLPIRRVFFIEAALNRALAHRKLRGNFGERRKPRKSITSEVASVASRVMEWSVQ